MTTIPDEFVPLYVRYYRDKAIRRAGNDAELMFTRALAFSRANRTAGRIEDFDLEEVGRGMADPEAAAAALVRVGLWVMSGDGWLIRSWEKWNGTNDQAAAGKLGNHVRWHLGKGVVKDDCPHCASPDPSHPIAPESHPMDSDIAPESHPSRPGHRTRSQKKKEKEIPYGGELALIPAQGTPTASSEATNSQPLIAEWLERCAVRPPGSIIGQVGKHVKAMLDEGIPAATISEAIAVWQQKGLHPSTLPSVANEVANAAPRQQMSTRYAPAPVKYVTPPPRDNPKPNPFRLAGLFEDESAS